MKVFGAVAACFLLCTSASFAQINVQGEDGSTVSIGPNGITINGTKTGGRANVKMGPGGIQIDSDNGYRRARVNLGAGAQVQTGKRAVSKTVTSRIKRNVPTTVKTTTVTTTAQSVQPSGLSASEQVKLIEMKIYGQSFTAKPLMTRIEKLEVDNLGQKGNGPLKTRINILAKELGVSLTTVSTTVVNNQNYASTVEIASPAAVASTINIQETPHHNSVAAGHELSNMVINESNQTITGNCNGNSIVLNGNNCKLMLSGKLGLVTINGNQNRIKSDSIGLVVANGNSNNVTWSHPQGAPQISNNGKDNAIHQQ